LVGDAALLLPAESVQARTESVAAESAEPGQPIAGPGRRRVVLIPRGGHDAYNDALVELARRLAAAHVQLAVMVLHPDQDRAPARRIVDAAVGTPTWQPQTAAQTIELLSAAEVVASARLHGCILAA